MNLEDSVNQICDELASKIETLRRVFKAKAQDNFIFSSNGTEIGKDKKGEPLERTVHEAVLELEKTKKHFKSKTIKEVREKLIRALKE